MATFKRVSLTFLDGVIDEMIEALDEPLTHAGDTSKELRQAFMHHWKGPRPGIEVTIFRDGDKKGVRVAMTGSGIGFMKWIWLKGTRVRYAQMSDDFIPKTTPTSILSRPGRGRMEYVDTSMPNPGIEDRRVKEHAAAIVTPTLDYEARQALLGVLKRT